MQCKNLCVCLAITVFMLTSLSMVSSKATKGNQKDSCSKKTLCKYGGHCDTSGTCRCNFDCSPMQWQTTFYCGPKQKDGKMRRYFFNLCEVLAHACELQRDIPIVKLNAYLGRCEDEVVPSTQFCPHPKDFMGPCGGTSSVNGNVGAGICLKDTLSGKRHCECPITRDGEDCQKRRSVTSQIKKDNSDAQKPSISSYLTFAVGCLLILIAVSCILIVRYKTNVGRRGETDSGARELSPFLKEACAEKGLDTKALTSGSCEKTVQKKQQFAFLREDETCNKVDSIVSLKADQPQRERLSGCSLAVDSDRSLTAVHPNFSSKDTKQPKILSGIECNNNIIIHR